MTRHGRRSSTNIDYDAKGQRDADRLRQRRQRPTYDYDPLTFRLIHLQTRAHAGPTIARSRLADGRLPVQDLHYTYDPAGNITHIRDDAQQTIYFRNQRVEPSDDYTYDAIYRLIEATGREHIGPDGDANPQTTCERRLPRSAGLPHPDDGKAMRQLHRAATSTTRSATSWRCMHQAAANGAAGRAPTPTTKPA